MPAPPIQVKIGPGKVKRGREEDRDTARLNRPTRQGEHAAIIDRELWDKVHAMVQQSPRTRASKTRAQTPVLLKDSSSAQAAFSPEHTRRRDWLHRYYVSQAVLKHGRDACPIGRVPAGEIESAVVDQLRTVFRQPEIVVGTWWAARGQDESITEAEVRDALLQVDPLWEELFPAERRALSSCWSCASTSARTGSMCGSA